MGYWQGIKEEGIDFKGMKLVLIGTGGAATAIAVRGALDGIAQLDILISGINSMQEGKRFVETINQNTDCKAYMHDLADLALLKAKMREADLSVMRPALACIRLRISAISRIRPISVRI